MEKYFDNYKGGLIFEGEYLNGEINGKGRENYFNNILIFEGEYLNGKKNGKIKEYFKGKLKFEGEYINGLRNGKGKEYDLFGNLIFEGEYLYNERRKGKAFTQGRLEYEGEDLFRKKWNGKGYDKNGNIIYELKNGNGKVKEYNYWDGRFEFEGEYLHGQRNGIGKEYNFDGRLIFEGEYNKGKKIYRCNKCKKCGCFYCLISSFIINSFLLLIVLYSLYKE